MKKVAIFLAVLIMIACNSNTKETPNGLKYNVYKEGDGTVGKSGQILAFNLKIEDSKDSSWVDTYEMGMPTFYQIADSSKMKEEDGFSQVMRMLSSGDSIGFSIALKELYSKWIKQPFPKEYDSTLTLTYTLSVEKILNEDEYQPYFTELNTAFNERQLAKDTVAIKEYLTSNKIEAKKLPSGIYYTITNEGEGETAQSGQKVSVNYAGYLLDGVYFDTNIESVAQEKGLFNPARAAQMGYAPFDVVVDQSGVIPGWHVALKELKAGGKGTFYIPSTLAYGMQGGRPPIKSNAILVFDIEAVSIN